MMAVTHIIFAVFLSLIFTRDPVFLAVAAASSLLPDIDDSRSFIGRIFIFSHIVRRIAGHRTITHSFLFALLVSLITLPLAGVKVALAVFLGMASHGLADSLGNSQELIVLFNRFTNIPVVAHHRVALVNEVYRRHGVRMEYISHNTEEGQELVKSGFCVYIAPKGAKVLLDKPTRKALVSGWALTFRNGFPLSDHADYPSLINYVARVRPKIVYTYPGGYSGRVLADRIRKVLGIPAQPLR